MSIRTPVLVTMKVKPHVWNLRARRAFERLVPALFAARARNGMTLAHFSVKLRPGAIDPCSSAAAFSGWARRVIAESELARAAASCTMPARSWLLAIGWRRGGPLLDPDHRPGSMP